jgi:hypothetical protein
MTTLAKLERDQSFNPQIFNMNFEENEKIQAEIDMANRLKELEDKQKLEYEKKNIIPPYIDDFGIKMTNMLFKIIEMLNNKENPLTFIMSSQTNQLTFTIMLLIFGSLIFILSIVLSS